MDDRTLNKSQVDPKMSQMNFLASDADIDRMMAGEEPRAVPRMMRGNNKDVYSNQDMSFLGRRNFPNPTRPQGSNRENRGVIPPWMGTNVGGNPFLSQMGERGNGLGDGNDQMNLLGPVMLPDSDGNGQDTNQFSNQPQLQSQKQNLQPNFGDTIFPNNPPGQPFDNSSGFGAGPVPGNFSMMPSVSQGQPIGTMQPNFQSPDNGAGNLGFFNNKQSGQQFLEGGEMMDGIFPQQRPFDNSMKQVVPNTMDLPLDGQRAMSTRPSQPEFSFSTFTMRSGSGSVPDFRSMLQPFSMLSQMQMSDPSGFTAFMTQMQVIRSPGNLNREASFMQLQMSHLTRAPNPLMDMQRELYLDRLMQMQRMYMTNMGSNDPNRGLPNQQNLYLQDSSTSSMTNNQGNTQYQTNNENMEDNWQPGNFSGAAANPNQTGWPMQANTQNMFDGQEKLKISHQDQTELGNENKQPVNYTTFPTLTPKHHSTSTVGSTGGSNSSLPNATPMTPGPMSPRLDPTASSPAPLTPSSAIMSSSSAISPSASTIQHGRGLDQFGRGGRFRTESLSSREQDAVDNDTLNLFQFPPTSSSLSRQTSVTTPNSQTPNYDSSPFHSPERIQLAKAQKSLEMNYTNSTQPLLSNEMSDTFLAPSSRCLPGSGNPHQLNIGSSSASMDDDKQISPTVDDLIKNYDIGDIQFEEDLPASFSQFQPASLFDKGLKAPEQQNSVTSNLLSAHPNVSASSALSDHQRANVPVSNQLWLNQQDLLGGDALQTAQSSAMAHVGSNFGMPDQNIMNNGINNSQPNFGLGNYDGPNNPLSSPNFSLPYGFNDLMQGPGFGQGFAGNIMGSPPLADAPATKRKRRGRRKSGVDDQGAPKTPKPRKRRGKAKKNAEEVASNVNNNTFETSANHISNAEDKDTSRVSNENRNVDTLPVVTQPRGSSAENEKFRDEIQYRFSQNADDINSQTNRGSDLLGANQFNNFPSKLSTSDLNTGQPNDRNSAEGYGFSNLGPESNVNTLQRENTDNVEKNQQLYSNNINWNAGHLQGSQNARVITSSSASRENNSRERPIQPGNQWAPPQQDVKSANQLHAGNPFDDFDFESASDGADNESIHASVHEGNKAENVEFRELRESNVGMLPSLQYPTAYNTPRESHQYSGDDQDQMLKQQDSYKTNKALDYEYSEVSNNRDVNSSTPINEEKHRDNTSKNDLPSLKINKALGKKLILKTENKNVKDLLSKLKDSFKGISPAKDPVSQDHQSTAEENKATKLGDDKVPTTQTPQSKDILETEPLTSESLSLKMLPNTGPTVGQSPNILPSVDSAVRESQSVDVLPKVQQSKNDGLSFKILPDVEVSSPACDAVDEGSSFNEEKVPESPVGDNETILDQGHAPDSQPTLEKSNVFIPEKSTQVDASAIEKPGGAILSPELIVHKPILQENVPLRSFPSFEDDSDDEIADGIYTPVSTALSQVVSSLLEKPVTSLSSEDQIDRPRVQEDNQFENNESKMFPGYRKLQFSSIPSQALESIEMRKKSYEVQSRVQKDYIKEMSPDVMSAITHESTDQKRVKNVYDAPFKAPLRLPDGAVVTDLDKKDTTLRGIGATGIYVGIVPPEGRCLDINTASLENPNGFSKFQQDPDNPRLIVKQNEPSRSFPNVNSMKETTTFDQGKTESMVGISSGSFGFASQHHLPEGSTIDSAMVEQIFQASPEPEPIIQRKEKKKVKKKDSQEIIKGRRKIKAKEKKVEVQTHLTLLDNPTLDVDSANKAPEPVTGLSSKDTPHAIEELKNTSVFDFPNSPETSLYGVPKRRGKDMNHLEEQVLISQINDIHADMAYLKSCSSALRKGSLHSKNKNKEHFGLIGKTGDETTREDSDLSDSSTCSSDGIRSEFEYRIDFNPENAASMVVPLKAVFKKRGKPATETRDVASNSDSLVSVQGDSSISASKREPDIANESGICTDIPATGNNREPVKEVAKIQQELRTAGIAIKCSVTKIHSSITSESESTPDVKIFGDVRSGITGTSEFQTEIATDISNKAGASLLTPKVVKDRGVEKHIAKATNVVISQGEKTVKSEWTLLKKGVADFHEKLPEDFDNTFAPAQQENLGITLRNKRICMSPPTDLQHSKRAKRGSSHPLSPKTVQFVADETIETCIQGDKHTVVIKDDSQKTENLSVCSKCTGQSIGGLTNKEPGSNSNKPSNVKSEEKTGDNILTADNEIGPPSSVTECSCTTRQNNILKEENSSQVRPYEGSEVVKASRAEKLGTTGEIDKKMVAKNNLEVTECEKEPGTPLRCTDHAELLVENAPLPLACHNLLSSASTSGEQNIVTTMGNKNEMGVQLVTPDASSEVIFQDGHLNPTPTRGRGRGWRRGRKRKSNSKGARSVAPKSTSRRGEIGSVFPTGSAVSGTTYGGIPETHIGEPDVTPIVVGDEKNSSEIKTKIPVEHQKNREYISQVVIGSAKGGTAKENTRSMTKSNEELKDETHVSSVVGSPRQIKDSTAQVASNEETPKEEASSLEEKIETIVENNKEGLEATSSSSGQPSDSLRSSDAAAVAHEPVLKAASHVMVESTTTNVITAAVHSKETLASGSKNDQKGEQSTHDDALCSPKANETRTVLMEKSVTEMLQNTGSSVSGHDVQLLPVSTEIVQKKKRKHRGRRNPFAKKKKKTYFPPHLSLLENVETSEPVACSANVSDPASHSALSISEVPEGSEGEGRANDKEAGSTQCQASVPLSAVSVKKQNIANEEVVVQSSPARKTRKSSIVPDSIASNEQKISCLLPLVSETANTSENTQKQENDQGEQSSLGLSNASGSKKNGSKKKKKKFWFPDQNTQDRSSSDASEMSESQLKEPETIASDNTKEKVENAIEVPDKQDLLAVKEPQEKKKEATTELKEKTNLTGTFSDSSEVPETPSVLQPVIFSPSVYQNESVLPPPRNRSKKKRQGSRRARSSKSKSKAKQPLVSTGGEADASKIDTQSHAKKKPETVKAKPRDSISRIHELNLLGITTIPDFEQEGVGVRTRHKAQEEKRALSRLSESSVDGNAPEQIVVNPEVSNTEKEEKLPVSPQKGRSRAKRNSVGEVLSPEKKTEAVKQILSTAPIPEIPRRTRSTRSSANSVSFESAPVVEKVPTATISNKTTEVFQDNKTTPQRKNKKGSKVTKELKTPTEVPSAAQIIQNISAGQSKKTGSKRRGGTSRKRRRGKKKKDTVNVAGAVERPFAVKTEEVNNDEYLAKKRRLDELLYKSEDSDDNGLDVSAGYLDVENHLIGASAPTSNANLYDEVTDIVPKKEIQAPHTSEEINESKDPSILALAPPPSLPEEVESNQELINVGPFANVAFKGKSEDLLCVSSAENADMEMKESKKKGNRKFTIDAICSKLGARVASTKDHEAEVDKTLPTTKSEGNSPVHERDIEQGMGNILEKNFSLESIKGDTACRSLSERAETSEGALMFTKGVDCVQGPTLVADVPEAGTDTLREKNERDLPRQRSVSLPSCPKTEKKKPLRKRKDSSSFDPYRDDDSVFNVGKTSINEDNLDCPQRQSRRRTCANVSYIQYLESSSDEGEESMKEVHQQKGKRHKKPGGKRKPSDSSFGVLSPGHLDKTQKQTTGIGQTVSPHKTVPVLATRADTKMGFQEDLGKSASSNDISKQPETVSAGDKGKGVKPPTKIRIVYNKGTREIGHQEAINLGLRILKGKGLLKGNASAEIIFEEKSPGEMSGDGVPGVAKTRVVKTVTISNISNLASTSLDASSFNAKITVSKGKTQGGAVKPVLPSVVTQEKPGAVVKPQSIVSARGKEDTYKSAITGPPQKGLDQVIKKDEDLVPSKEPKTVSDITEPIVEGESASKPPQQLAPIGAARTNQCIDADKKEALTSSILSSTPSLAVSTAPVLENRKTPPKEDILPPPGLEVTGCVGDGAVAREGVDANQKKSTSKSLENCVEKCLSSCLKAFKETSKSVSVPKVSQPTVLVLKGNLPTDQKVSAESSESSSGLSTQDSNLNDSNSPALLLAPEGAPVVNKAVNSTIPENRSCSEPNVDEKKSKLVDLPSEDEAKEEKILETLEATRLSKRSSEKQVTAVGNDKPQNIECSIKTPSFSEISNEEGVPQKPPNMSKSDTLTSGGENNSTKDLRSPSTTASLANITASHNTSNEKYQQSESDVKTVVDESNCTDKLHLQNNDIPAGGKVTQTQDVNHASLTSCTSKKQENVANTLEPSNKLFVSDSQHLQSQADKVSLTSVDGITCTSQISVKKDIVSYSPSDPKVKQPPTTAGDVDCDVQKKSTTLVNIKKEKENETSVVSHTATDVLSVGKDIQIHPALKDVKGCIADDCKPDSSADVNETVELREELTDQTGKGEVSHQRKENSQESDGLISSSCENSSLSVSRPSSPSSYGTDDSDQVGEGNEGYSRGDMTIRPSIGGTDKVDNVKQEALTPTSLFEEVMVKSEPTCSVGAKEKQKRKTLTLAQELAMKRTFGSFPPDARDQKKGISKPITLIRKRGPRKQNHKFDYFLQEGSCKATPKLPRCRDCRNPDHDVNFCRFSLFRRLRRNIKTGKVEAAGFCRPDQAVDEDFKPWKAARDVTLDYDMCKYIIENVGGQFCEVVEEEYKAGTWGSKDGAVAWKRAVGGVREMCDVCATTIFNIHWVCEKCGFGVCLDCYRMKLEDKMKSEEGTKKSEVLRWVSCAPGLGHKPESLTVTQIIPMTELWDLCRELVKTSEELGIKFNLPEKPYYETFRSTNNKTSPPDENPLPICIRSATNVSHDSSGKQKNISTTSDTSKTDISTNCTSSLGELPPNDSTLNAESLSEPKVVESKPDSSLHDVAAVVDKKPEILPQAHTLSNVSDKEPSKEQSLHNSSGLQIKKVQEGENTDYRNLVEKAHSVINTIEQWRREFRLNKEQTTTGRCTSENSTSGQEKQDESKSDETTDAAKQRLSNLDILAMIASGMEDKTNENEEAVTEQPKTATVGESSDSSNSATTVTREVNCSAQVDKSLIFDYFCENKMIRLKQPHNATNHRLFRAHWKSGEPILVSNVNQLLNPDLWNPTSFAEEFGDENADVVNCRTHQVIENFSVAEFWIGFESVKDRPVDNQERPMLLKLKDWPPGADFSDKLPTRFKDLMQALPVPEYTRRNGTWNLVSRLAKFFVKPDLGPKMYNAYGSAAVPSAGTTNLHLDISDAVNVMVYVGLPKEEDLRVKESIDTLKTIDMACDDVTRKRVRNNVDVPGALWHIYVPEDTNTIREFLRKVQSERRKTKISPHSDPIHDQAIYLDHDLRKRLKEEYNVTGYAICQCLGDAVFIPAGAPHQVLNLHSCVKVAEDFVSPEHVGHCFKLTQEFRHLSDKHTNHEDKLQVKNIIYHAVKDSVAVMKNKLHQQREEELERLQTKC